jgi:cyanamide hydratase
MNECWWRTGGEDAAAAAAAWDAETFYLASMLHDLKCTAKAFEQSHVSFELHGGSAARAFLVDVAGAPPRVGDAVMEAICRHKDTDPSSYGFSPEAQLLRFGAQLDALGIYAELIHPRSIADVVAAFPRLGFNDLFADTLLLEARVKRFCTSVALLVPGPGGVQAQIRRNPAMKEFDGWE